jgi:hypothetical protein
MTTKTNNERVLEERLAGIPGAEVVLKGLRELKYGPPSECGLLVLVASPRIRSIGIEVPERMDVPLPYEHQLYSLLEITHGDDAFSHYNSLLRRIDSFAHALEHRLSIAKREAPR